MKFACCFALVSIMFATVSTSLAGCNEQIPPLAKAALADASEMEFFSLNPNPPEKKPEDAEMLQSWIVLGKMKMDEEETCSVLADKLIDAINNSDGMVAGCFNPRHGIRLTHEKKKHEFVICFECLQVQWYIDGEKQDTILTTSDPSDAFSKILKDAGVELPRN